MLITGIHDAIQVIGGHQISLAITSDRCNYAGQLGYGDNIDRHVPIPTKVAAVANVAFVSVGLSEHRIIAISDGNMFTSGAEDRLGRDGENRVPGAVPLGDTGTET